MNVYGELGTAQLENLAANPGTVLVPGRVFYRTDVKQGVLYTGSAFVNFSPVIGETAFTIANNQAGAANVTGLVFASATYRSALIDYDIRRQTDTAATEKRAVGRFVLFYRTQTTTWELQTIDEWGDNDHGVTFTVVGASGQVQYTSTNIAGANYVGKLSFMANAFVL